ncbi:MAG: HD domain-containing protein [Spirochaetales bacterium]|nr:HD domain-containing protein [Spirochaetales bacterium]
MVMGHKPLDYDLATDATPEDVIKLFHRVIPTGIRHGTVTILFQGHSVEVTTFRIDGTYSNLRHPDSVSFTPSIEKDLERRDFTMNALALDLATGALLDPHDGKEDLQKGIIRAIGNPVERFSEDGLRLLRACRFSSQLGFLVHPDTLEGMKKTHGNILKVSVERIRSEIEKILSSPKPSLAFRIMDQTGLLEDILPDLAAARKVGEKGSAGLDVLEHSLKACDGAPADNLPVRLAALLHDLGKPGCRVVHPDGRETYHGHEKVSEELARNFMKKYRFPKLVEERVCRLVYHHMFDYQPDWPDSALRRLIFRVGTEYLDDLILLREADHYGGGGAIKKHPYLDDLRKRISYLLHSGDPLGPRDLAVNGHTLHEEAGIPEGRAMGTILSHLVETVLDDPAQNKKDILLKIARNLYLSIQG